ncbi:MAG: hypothetical protein C4B59_01605 [Candidatus Methanogaster sp.]|uniref:Uncharacterized protein n=1 Tax=Candidatus Methanogaster sp. TaxID=3386292 RepID=A0AC61L681_9EURY|nr:MAG: hypothetical protein C4B59_01605 [ANME-2 cluster archaeon]
MTRHSPTTETRTVLRTILSAGVLIVLLVLVCLGTAAAACPNDEDMGTVNFRGVVTGEPTIDSVGAGGVNVRIDEILSDPIGNLTVGDVVTVGYPIVPPFADIDATVGDLVEVCGEYCGAPEPLDWSGVGDHIVWLHAPDHFYRLLSPTAAASNATGTPKDIYLDDEDVYATGSGFRAGTDVDIFVVSHRGWGWSDGDSIPSRGLVTVSDGTVSTSGDLSPVLVWHAPLVPDECGIGYDIVIDANQNGVYDASTDGLDSGSPSFDVIIRMPSAPVPALTPIGVIALVGLLCVIGMFRIRRRFD